LGVIQSPCWNTKSTRPMYRIAVPCSHGNHSRVLESIPVIGKRKKALALGLKQGKEISGSDWHFSLPKSVSTYASSVASWRDQGKRMKRNQCLKLATQEKNNHLLKMWGNSDVIWDSVISVKQIGKHQTYDLSVEGVASFIVEGVVTHNSGAIEQVADVVGFIHRPEYYGTTYCEEYGDVTGKAFLFIDKDRNGPTGEVELYWNKNLACFEEYAP
ncbi:MAG: hypothetical protein KJ556_21840, partial [Gammaproteobacteria bacterium]|nr:hypothetical protein [Gammaproteobacteria bacterium]